MERIKRLIYLLLMLNTFTLFSQEANETVVDTELVNESSDYTFTQTNHGVVFIQRLFWEPSEYVFKYDVIIEENNGESWQEVLRQEQSESFIEVSLKVGKYRYKVVSYNFLGKEESQSEWSEFEIFEAIQPRISNIHPMHFWLEENDDGIIKINGSGFSDDTVFCLKGKDSEIQIVNGSILSVSQDGHSAEIQFPLSIIDIGDYQFIAKNPSGLNEVKEPVIIRFNKLMDLDISSGYAATLFVQKALDECQTIGDYFGFNLNPFTPTVRITWIFLKSVTGYWGVNVTPTFFDLVSKKEGYTLTTSVFNINCNLVYRYPIIKKKLVLDGHIGVGALLFSDMQFDYGYSYQSPKFSSLNLSATVGATIQFFLSKYFFCEAGCDFTMNFLPNDYTLGLLIPYVNIGWQF